MNVIIPWIPSHWNELRYSTKSILRNYKNLDKIYIVSESNPHIPKTEWIYFPNADLGPKDLDYYIRREAHINEKIYSAAKEIGCDEFVYQGDDMYWIKPVDDRTFRGPQPWLQKISLQNIQEAIASISRDGAVSWKYCLLKTLLYLASKDKPYINYTNHIPVRITIEEMEASKEFFRSWNFQLESGLFNLSSRPRGIEVKESKLKKGCYRKDTSLKDVSFL